MMSENDDEDEDENENEDEDDDDDDDDVVNDDENLKSSTVISKSGRRKKNTIFRTSKYYIAAFQK